MLVANCCFFGYQVTPLPRCRRQFVCVLARGFEPDIAIATKRARPDFLLAGSFTPSPPRGSVVTAAWLRLLDDRPACGKCVRASGLIYRSQSVRTEKRHTVTAPPRLARLNSDWPLRVHPRPGRTIDRRASLEARLRRSLLIVARQFAIDEHDERLAKLLNDTLANSRHCRRSRPRYGHRGSFAPRLQRHRRGR